ncbi:MAG: hypothetical protein K0Q50_2685 [Vampirovibrio sp.]|nr:hypothetical protein [Vampirovibrio sp.]
MLKNKKQLISLSLVLGLLAAFTLYKLAIEFGGVPGKLYQYYPASTGFYLELAPGEKLTRRFVAFLQEQNLQEEQSRAKQKKAMLAELQKQDAGKLSPQQMQALLPPEDESQRKSFRRVFLEKFNSTFEPYLSLGAWPDRSKAQPSTLIGQTGEGNTLIVLPLKDNLDLAAVIERFGLDLKDFKQINTKDESYLEEKNSGTALAVLNRKLLITNTPEAMQATLKHYREHQPNVFDQAINKTYLAKLPWLRQGTFILNNSVYTRKALESKGKLSAQVAGMSDIFPLTVGAIQAKADQRVSVRFITPIQFNNIADKHLRNSLQAIAQPAEAFTQAGQLPADTGMMIGMIGLDKAYDFYQDYMMPAENARWLKMMEIILSGFRVDLRKDVINLLEKRTVIASRFGDKPSLIMLLEKNEAKDKSLDKISTLLSTNAFPIKQETEQVNEVTSRMLSLPVPIPGHADSRLQYGTIGTALVFATPADFRETVDVSRKQQKSLAETPSYRVVMDGLPNLTNAVAYLNIAEQSRFSKAPTGMQSPGQWLDSLGLALWVTPQQQQEDVSILNAQLNLKLTNLQKPKK